MSRSPLTLALGGLLTGLALLALAVVLSMRPAPLDADTVPEATRERVERGAQLARAGNCIACHSARGGEAGAGGRGVTTPFGTIYSSNLTPHASGLGDWSAAEFHRALHHGQSRDGRLLYPAFPYDHTTLLTREDTDALWVWLRTLPPVDQPRRAHGLRFPFDQPAALAVWRALYFTPGPYRPDPARSAEWNRGAYLVRGAAHCAACHSTRGALGGPGEPFGGGPMPDGRWWAPSLLDPAEAGVQRWPLEAVVALLRDGRHGDASVQGPMAEVVHQGTQHLNEADLRAMAVFLRELPLQATPRAAFEPAEPTVMALGQRLYERHCADCHGAQGEGAAGAYPPLAGNRAVTLASPVNTLQTILSGGFGPTTAAHPRPYGMPPYRSLLDDAEVAAVATYLRQSWGHRASAVGALDVQRVR